MRRGREVMWRMLGLLVVKACARGFGDVLRVERVKGFTTRRESRVSCLEAAI